MEELYNANFENQGEEIEDKLKTLRGAAEFDSDLEIVSPEKVSEIFENGEKTVEAIIAFNSQNKDKILREIKKGIEKFLNLGEEDLYIKDAIREVFMNALTHGSNENLIGFKCSKENENEWELTVANFSNEEIAPEFKKLIKDTENASIEEAERICGEFGTKRTIEALNNNKDDYEDSQTVHQRGIIECCGACRVSYKPIQKGEEILGHVFSLEPRE